jgi:hypothetical protein
LLSELGHEVIVANARKVRLIGESRKKDDRLDAQTLARLARIDPQLLYPVKHRSVLNSVLNGGLAPKRQNAPFCSFPVENAREHNGLWGNRNSFSK